VISTGWGLASARKCEAWRMAMKKHHVVILFDGIKPIANPFAIKCERCGQELQVSMPISVDMINGIQKAFLREHKTCEYPPVENNCSGVKLAMDDLMTDRTDSVADYLNKIPAYTEPAIAADKQ
jgi:hypothetical protein